MNSAASSEELQTQRKTAQWRVLIVTLVVLGVISGGSFACVGFGVSEVIHNDTILMNDGLGEVMTVLGICFAFPSLLCIVAFIVLALRIRCCSALFCSSSHVIIGLTIVSFLVQQSLADAYLISFLGPGAAACVVLDICVLGCSVLWRSHGLYIPVSFSVVLFVVKMIALWCVTSQRRHTRQPNSSGVLTALFLSIPIVQLPLFITALSDLTPITEVLSSKVSIAENFNNNFNLHLLHLLNTLDVITLYTSFVTPWLKEAMFKATPLPFEYLIIILISVGFVGNNIAVIHLFYRRDGVEYAELMCLPRKLRDATDQWSVSDVDGSHKRRILQYMLLLLVVCDVPFLGVRMQLWWGGHQMLSVFVIKNIKSILDTVMIVHHAEHSDSDADHDRYLLPDGF